MLQRKETGGECGAARKVPEVMEFIPGEPDRRPERVVACASRTIAIREAERDIMLHTLIGVQLDVRMKLSCDGVCRDALRQLHISACNLLITKPKAATFLLRFGRPNNAMLCWGGGCSLSDEYSYNSCRGLSTGTEFVSALRVCQCMERK